MFRSLAKSHLLVLVFIIVVVVTVGVLTYLIRANDTKKAANQAAETLFAGGKETPYIDTNGAPVTFNEFLGKIIIVNSWASWSPLSVQELQDLQTVAKEYVDKDVIVIAVNRKENRDQADRFLSTLPPLPEIKIVTDTEDYFYNVMGGYAMPETIIYNQAGTIVLHRQGVMKLEELRDEINLILSNQ